MIATAPHPPAIIAIAKPLKSVSSQIRPRIVLSAHWYVDYSPAPKIPKGCVVRYGHNNAAAKRMGIVSAAWSCS